MIAPRLSLREALPEESREIYEFYEKTRDRYVLPRPETDLRRSAEKGLFFIGQAQGQIAAVAGVFDLGLDPYVELGGTFVDPSFRGYRLQSLFFQLRIAAIIVNQGPQARMLTAIDPSNVYSAENARKTGFETWVSPVPKVFEPCQTCSKREAAFAANRPCCCDFFILSDTKARQKIAELLARSGNGLIIPMPGKDDKSLTVAIQSPLLAPPYREALEDYASGGTWRPANN